MKKKVSYWLDLFPKRQHILNQVNNAVATNISQAQWIDLGVHAEACMTRPETCGAAGGAVSFWMKLIDCNDFGGVISTVSLSETGFQVYCSENKTK